MKLVPVRAFVAVAAGVALGALGCGGGGASPSGPSVPSGPGSGPEPAATITLSSTGVSPKTTRIQVGQSVRFVNSDGSLHVPSSDPHPTHSDCPAVNAAGTVTAGASRTTGAFNAERACGFHDHNNPDDARFRGQIVVGSAPEAPGY